MRVNLSSGNYNIIASGEVFLFDPFGDITINIENDEGFHISLVLKFFENDSGNHNIATEIVGDSLVISCYNFRGLGTGIKRPVHIADVDGKQVYLLFSSQYMSTREQQTRNVKFTVFLEK